MKRNFSVIVIGGGHAGTEAALAAARLGADTALITPSRSNIGQLSCNPAIGGLGKGQLVKEIDALGGLMALATDLGGIQFRTLNSSKGVAVRSSRAQADRDLYQKAVLKAVEENENLTLIEAFVEELIVKGNDVLGVIFGKGEKLFARSTVLTTGTFLCGLMHTGSKSTPGGRVGEAATIKLSNALQNLGLKMGRLKTGTPPRLALHSIDFSKLVEQPGDTPIRPFSSRTKAIDRKQISCWITETNEKTHEIIRANLSSSPMFNGQILSTGARYCPSIEDKVYRFSDKNSHNIFLEPEGYNSKVVYPNGISTSLPSLIQKEFLHSIKGLENARILQDGYAVEYDFVQPTQLDHTLKLKSLRGLFLAGQINGTSGYEEAGAQGLLAGINAGKTAMEESPIMFGREEAYIGVMIDDLCSRGVLEPYRMFTSRAEFRLHLREDNADYRLTPVARKLGLIEEDCWAEFENKMAIMESEKGRLEKTIVKPGERENAWLKDLGSARIKDAIDLASLLRRPEISYENLSMEFPPPMPLENFLSERVEASIKLAGYLKRQEVEVQKLKKMEQIKIPQGFSFEQVNGLSIEVRQRLREVSPKTLGQASRISGITPASLSLIGIHLKRDCLRRR